MNKEANILKPQNSKNFGSRKSEGSEDFLGNREAIKEGIVEIVGGLKISAYENGNGLHLDGLAEVDLSYETALQTFIEFYNSTIHPIKPENLKIGERDGVEMVVQREMMLKGEKKTIIRGYTLDESGKVKEVDFWHKLNPVPEAFHFNGDEIPATLYSGNYISFKKTHNYRSD